MDTIQRHVPGSIRDAILELLLSSDEPQTVKKIHSYVKVQIGDVARSSVQSYLSNNQPNIFTRVSRGKYSISYNLKKKKLPTRFETITLGKGKIIHGDCFDVMSSFEANSIEAIVSDPPYGLVEYTKKEIDKLRAGKGGVWRVPPSFDGHVRAPLPRFTTLTKQDHLNMEAFFFRFGKTANRILVPGAHIILACNPLLSHLVTSALTRAGFENRGSIIRKVITMRGGDRPKNAHTEFSDVSVMPRSSWEPWILVRKPLEGRVQDNLRKWRTGGLRRISELQPFFDFIESHPTQKHEKSIAPHPSLKPQKFLRQITRASLPLSEGTILDPFSGSGSTIAAANAMGLQSIGIEADDEYFKLSESAVPKLQKIIVNL